MVSFLTPTHFHRAPAHSHVPHILETEFLTIKTPHCPGWRASLERALNSSERNSRARAENGAIWAGGQKEETSVRRQLRRDEIAITKR